MRKYALSFVSVLLLTAGCTSNKPRFTKEQLAEMPLAQRTGLPGCSGGMVLAVAGETVTSDEIINPLMNHFGQTAQRTSLEQFKEKTREQLRQVVVDKITNILLYQEAKKDAGDIDEALGKAVQREVRKFLVSFNGNYARAEDELKRMGMNWADFEEYQKKMILSQSYIHQKLPQQKPVTYSEMVDYYNQIKHDSFAIPAILTFRLIDIEPAKLELSDPNKTAHRQAEELAKHLIERLIAGEDFGEVAKKYSHGYRASSGGLWDAVEPKALAEPYDILAAEAEKIKPGEIAGPIDAGDHIFIMKLEDKQAAGTEPFEKVQNQVEAKMIFEQRREALNKLSDRLIEQAAVGNMDAFIDFCIEETYRRSNP